MNAAIDQLAAAVQAMRELEVFQTQMLRNQQPEPDRARPSPARGMGL